MRVVMVSTRDDRCGIAAYAQDLAGALEGSGHEVVWVSLDAAQRRRPGFEQELPARIAALEPDVVHVQHEYSFFGRRPAPRRLRALARALRLPELHDVCSWGEIAAQVEAPLVVTVHELELPQEARLTEVGHRWLWHRALLRLADASAFARADKVICHGPKRRKELMEMGVPEHRIATIPIGIKGLPALPSRAEARSRLGLDARPLVLAFGFVSPRKRLDRLVASLPSLPPTTMLAVVGGPPPDGEDLRPTLERQAAELGLAERVLFAGHVDDVTLRDWLAAADVHAMVPDAMGDGSMALNTAVAAGLPSVVGDLPAARVLQSRWGCLVLAALSDDEVLPTQLNRVLSQPAFAAHLRARTLAAAEASGTGAEAEAVGEVYASVASTDTAARRATRRAAIHPAQGLIQLLRDERRSQMRPVSDTV
jgi:glycosyltransferase involved in cell wall biosynthesis